MKEILDTIFQLSVEERLQIFNALKENLDKFEDEILTQPQIEFLDERDAIIERGNYQTLTWEQIKKKLSHR